MEAHSYHFTPPLDSLNDITTDTDDDSDLVADVDPDTLIRIARMHANPLVEHTINSAMTNVAWDKYKTPISILKPPD